MKKAIVTGATGFIGSWLIRELIGQNVFVYAVDRAWLSGSNLLPQSELVRFVECELTNTKDLPNIIDDRDIDVFYHLAWQGASGIARKDYSIQLNNIKCSLDCATVCDEMKIKKFIPVGTVGEYMAQLSLENSISSENFVYALSKSFFHTLLNVYDKSLYVDVIWCTLSGIYGEGDQSTNLVNYTIKTLLRGENAKFTKAEQPFDFIHVSDCVHALYLVGEKSTSKKQFFIGSGKPKQLKEFLIEIERIIGGNAKVEIGALTDDGTVYRFEWFNSDDIFNEVGFIPKIAFEDGILGIIDCIKT